MTRAAQPRILVGRLFPESHAFSPFVTRASEFAVARGADLLAEARTSGTTLGGIVRQLDRLDAHVVPSVSASAPPSGLVDPEFYQLIKAELIDTAIMTAPDAIALELHGAMGTTGLADVEGDLLTALRSAVGPDVVIGVGLDLHGHLTPAMLAAADFCIACKANPHADIVECGEKVAVGVMSALEGAFDPVSTLVKVRMTLPGGMETTGGPLKALHDEARALAASIPISGISRSTTSIARWTMSTWVRPFALSRMATIRAPRGLQRGLRMHFGGGVTSSRTTFWK